MKFWMVWVRVKENSVDGPIKLFFTPRKEMLLEISDFFFFFA